MTKLIESASDWARRLTPLSSPGTPVSRLRRCKSAEMTPQGRKSEIKAFSHQYCFPTNESGEIRKFY